MGHMKSSNNMFIATWNVKALYLAGELASAETEMKRMRLGILGMSGVAILVSAGNVGLTKGLLPINKRIMLVRLNAQPIDVYRMQVYALTAQIEEFYADLQMVKK